VDWQRLDVPAIGPLVDPYGACGDGRPCSIRKIVERIWSIV
jgi:hypothetical protein